MVHHTLPFSRTPWIWTRETRKNQYVSFSCVFFAQGGRGTLYISADSDYVAHINGALAGFGQYDCYPFHMAYDALAVALRAGENRLEILCYYQGENSFQYVTGPAGLWFQVRDERRETLAASGTDVLCRDCALYRHGDMEKITGQLGYTFHADALALSPSWRNAVVVAARADTKRFARPIPRLVLEEALPALLIARGAFLYRGGNTTAERMQRAYLAAEDVPGIAEGIACPDGADGAYLVYDLGGEHAGLFTLDAQGPAGTLMEVAYGEHLDDLRVRAFVGGRNFAFSYRFSEGENRFTHYFKRLGGRYLLVFLSGTGGGLVRIRTLSVRPVSYPVRQKGRVESCDSIDARIYATGVRTLRLCMHEHYEDTPWREQAQYAMDSRNQALCGYCAFGETKLPLAFLRMFQASIRPDRLFEICAPARDRLTIPSFTLCWVLAARDYGLYSGDLAGMRGLYETALTVLRGFEECVAPNGLPQISEDSKYWHFYEWRPGLSGDTMFFPNAGAPFVAQDAPISLYLALALEACAQMARWLDCPAEEKRLLTLKRSLCAAIHAAFYDADAEAYRTRAAGDAHYAVFTQSLALLSGVPSARQSRALRRRLVNHPEDFVPVSLSCSLFYYEALLMDAQYRAFVLDDVRAKWGDMIYRGATTFWETEKGAADFDRAGSLCHGWSAVPVYLYTVALLGVRPEAPGFSAFSFDPAADARPSGCVPTPHGLIRIHDGDVTYPKGVRRINNPVASGTS